MEKAYPYDIRLKERYGNGQVIDLPGLVREVEEDWFNQTLCRVNDSLVRVGVVEGEFHWHKHENDDEFFFVLSGRLLIDLVEEETVELLPHQGYVVPKGVMHRPRAPERTIMLMVETSCIQPVGD